MGGGRAIEGGCSWRQIFNKKKMLVEGGMHVGNFPIKRGAKRR